MDFHTLPQPEQIGVFTEGVWESVFLTRAPGSSQPPSRWEPQLGKADAQNGQGALQLSR